MTDQLAGMKVAFLAADMTEKPELTEPYDALKEAGADVELLSIKEGEIDLFDHYDRAESFKVDRLVGEADASGYDALVLPGGVGNPDALRLDDDAVSFVREFFDQDKPVGAICHAPWMLIEAGVVSGRTLTSWPSLKTDLENAGAKRVDEEVVVDGRLVTSRKPDDLPAFNAKLIETFGAAASRTPQAAGSSS